MNLKKLLGLSIVTIGVVATVGILFGITLDDAENNIQNNIQNVPELTTPTYIPSDITKANPNFVVSDGEAAYAPLSAQQIAENIDLTLEGTVENIGDPILFVNPNGSVKAAIPITIHVDTLHKGDLNSDTFTFYLTAWAVFIDGYVAQSYSAIGKEPIVLPRVYRDYTVSEIINSEKTYGIYHEDGQFEIDDKIIIHIGEYTALSNALDSGSAVMITEYDLTPYYSTTSGEIDIYKIQNGVLFDYRGISQQYSAVLNISQDSP